MPTPEDDTNPSEKISAELAALGPDAKQHLIELIGQTLFEANAVLGEAWSEEEIEAWEGNPNRNDRDDIDYRGSPPSHSETGDQWRDVREALTAQPAPKPEPAVLAAMYDAFNALSETGQRKFGYWLAAQLDMDLVAASDSE